MQSIYTCKSKEFKLVAESARSLVVKNSKGAAQTDHFSLWNSVEIFHSWAIGKNFFHVNIFIKKDIETSLVFLIPVKCLHQYPTPVLGVTVLADVINSSKIIQFCATWWQKSIFTANDFDMKPCKSFMHDLIGAWICRYYHTNRHCTQPKCLPCRSLFYQKLFGQQSEKS